MKQLILLILVVFAVNSAKTEIINANSGSKTDIQSAINQAKSGDTVMVPAGNFNFSGTLNMPSGITLMGAGKDQTILRRTGSSTQYMIDVNSSNGLPFRITGIAFIGVAPNEGGGIKVKGDCYNFRIDHNSFRKLRNRAIVFYFADFRGLIDHNEFIDNYYTQIYINGNRDKPWEEPLRLGTEDAVFIEDNYFSQTNTANTALSHHVDGQYGAKWVFRYNTIEDESINSQAIGAHGAYVGSNENRGCRSYEIYNNTLSATSRYRAIKIRGGDGVIFGNAFNGSFSNNISITIMNEDASTGQGDNCTYPCQDQIRELYIWNNNTNGQASQIENIHPTIIKENRDYFLFERPNYTPYVYPHPLSSGNLQLQIITSIIPAAVVGSQYSATLSSIGGTPNYIWDISSGILPNGIELNSNTISGIPNDSEATYSFTIRVTDQEGSVATKNLSINLTSGIFSEISSFGNTENWEPDSPEKWTIEEQDNDKRYVILPGGLNSINEKLATYSLVKNRTYQDFEISFKVKSPVNLSSSNADFDIVFGYQDNNNYYYMMLNSNAPWNALYKVQNGNRSEIKNVNNSLITDNLYHDIKLYRRGNAIFLEKNSEIVFSTNDATFGEGQIGIGTFSDPVYFDDIEITDQVTGNPNPPPNPPQNVQVSGQ